MTLSDEELKYGSRSMLYVVVKNIRRDFKEANSITKDIDGRVI